MADCDELLLKTLVISNARDCFIELIHRESDPASWVVKCWTKFLCFKKQISSDWFNDEKQAFAFANEIKRHHKWR
ncbi:MAG TPA: hypothetical protein VIS48_03615 [Candidatus Kryptonia bacterium]